MNATAMILAVKLANLESRSALPEAPVVSEPRRRTWAGSTLAARDLTARVLRRAADRVQPVHPTCG